jgi:hypothetical protein
VKAFGDLLPQPSAQVLAAASRTGSGWVLFIGAVALVALAVAALYFWNQLRKTKAGGSRRSDQDLFAELCDAHELNKLERSLILQLASTYEVPQPAALFVDPWTLEQAASAPGPDANRFGALRQKLFGTLE